MDAMEALARFLPQFEAPGFTAGEFVGGEKVESRVFRMPFVTYSDAVSEFIQAAYANELVLRDFDWPIWAQTAEAAALRDDRAQLAEASPDQLKRLLTICIRQDRFVEGALLSAFESGLILNIVRRAAVLSARNAVQ